MAPLEVGPGPYEISTNIGGNETLIGYLWTQGSSEETQNYFVMLPNYQVPINFQNDGESLILMRQSEIGGHQIESANQLAEVVQSMYEGEDLNYQQSDEAYSEWDPF